MPEAEHAAGGGPGGWRPDNLGTGYEQLTLELPGGAPATLVRYTPAPAPSPAATADVLYVHGWSDYFFQRELAEYWAHSGARFYAVDLHNYGRSLRPGQSPGYVSDLSEYDDDIAAALAAMGQPGPVRSAPEQHAHGATANSGGTRPLILVGHSTGGLTLSLWAARHPFAASALVLNSPWLEFQATELGRRVISPLIGLEAQLRPLAPRALSLGSTVTVARIADAMHDVFLSAAPVRGRAYAAIDRWRGGYGPAARRMLRGPSTLRRRRRA